MIKQVNIQTVAVELWTQIYRWIRSEASRYEAVNQPFRKNSSVELLILAFPFRKYWWMEFKWSFSSPGSVDEIKSGRLVWLIGFYIVFIGW